MYSTKMEHEKRYKLILTSYFSFMHHAYCMKLLGIGSFVQGVGFVSCTTSLPMPSTIMMNSVVKFAKYSVPVPPSEPALRDEEGGLVSLLTDTTVLVH